MTPSSPERVLKRKRLDILDGGGPILEKHSSLWMSDGTIVLSAKSTLRSGHEILFKVHKSTLSMHSSVFRGMFELPDTPETLEVQDSYEGTPLVDVQDSAEDWVDLLRLLYGDLSGLSFKKYDPELEMSLMGVMRIVKKYDMEALRTRLVAQVEAQWPRTLKEWDVYGDYVKRVTHSSRPPDGTILEPASAIRFASEYDIPHILPVAFYMLSCISIKRDWDARGEQEKEKNCAWGMSLSARWRLLTTSDYARLIRGREELESPAYDYLCGISADNCYRPECEQTNARVSSEARERYYNSGLWRDILCMLDVHSKKEYWKSFCRTCSVDRLWRAREARADVWHRLPDMFGLEELPTWDPSESQPDSEDEDEDVDKYYDYL